MNSHAKATLWTPTCAWLRDAQGKIRDCKGMVREPLQQCPNCQLPTLIEEGPIDGPRATVSQFPIFSKSMGLATHYDADFYAMTVAKPGSAKSVLGRVFSLYKPASVADFGCGAGQWLSTAGEMGVSKLLGFDGPWVDREKLDKAITFSPMNFEGEFPKCDRVDMAMSLEVAEHISASRAADFVKLLTSTSDVVLFSAAIPNQGGTNHINEQPLSYWVKLFRDRGYTLFDVIRGAVWNDPDVFWWYRQNTVLFVRDGSAAIDVASLRSAHIPLVDVVHPVLFAERSKPVEVHSPTLASLLSDIRSYAKIRLRRLVGL